MRYLVVSCSLSQDSKSRILAKAALETLSAKGAEVDFLDLAETELPLCDGDSVFGDAAVQKVAAVIEAADGILVATPVYNFDVNAAAKNLIELTGRAWTEKVVGFMCAAGGPGSYMAAMAVANSLMLDFRTVIIPRFVYATGDAFQGGEIADLGVRERVDALAVELLRFSAALRGSA